MEHVESITPQAGDVLAIVGTVKGAFILSADHNRSRWRFAGPYFKGQSIFSTAYLPDKKAPRILVGNFSMHWGAVVSRSDDFGARWTEPADGNVKFPQGSGLSLNAVWALEGAPLVGRDVVFGALELHDLAQLLPSYSPARQNDARL